MRVDLYPVYNVYLNLNSLKNVDLATRGYYQVRIIPNPSSEFSSVDIQCAENFHNSLQSAILPGSIINGVAVSKTVELTYIDESLLLGTILSCKHLFID
uniref:DUF4154 domain-containing protein n=1 Tax=Heterorhabditis bacteriophora TaxID=37862 RepID=A0A1I7WP53_HETBA